MSLLSRRAAVIVLLAIFLLGAGGATSLLLASCGPFTDVGTLICPFVLELYYTGITAGTSATTYSPGDPVTRGQMAVFIATGLDQSLSRGSRRAALDQWWTATPHFDAALGLTTVGSTPAHLKCDGSDLWVPNYGDGTVSRVRASDGSLLGTWTGAVNPFAVLVAMGKVFVTGQTDPGTLYMIDPSQPPGAMTLVANNLGNGSAGIAFDGASIWTANGDVLGQGSVSKITPGTTAGAWNVLTYTAGLSSPHGILFDGASVWITDDGDPTHFPYLKKLDRNGVVLLQVSVGTFPQHPAFDGRNLWVPAEADNSLSVVRAADGTVLQTFSAANGNQNGLSAPVQAAFDGQRILVTNSGGGVSVFKAADLSIVGNYATPGLISPDGAACDGLNFWISDSLSNVIARF